MIFQSLRDFSSFMLAQILIYRSCRQYVASLTEILGGIFWVWLPIFGINEVPTANTIIGGSIITFALLYYSLNTKRNRRFIGLN